MSKDDPVYYVATGEAAALIDRLHASRMETRKEVSALARELGADEGTYIMDSVMNRPIGFLFDRGSEIPDGLRLAKSGPAKGHYVPNRRIVAGKEIEARMNALKPMCAQDVHRVFFPTRAFLNQCGIRMVGDDYIVTAVESWEPADGIGLERILASQFWGMVEAQDAKEGSPSC